MHDEYDPSISWGWEERSSGVGWFLLAAVDWEMRRGNSISLPGLMYTGTCQSSLDTGTQLVHAGLLMG
jgi:hypothetical protein